MPNKSELEISQIIQEPDDPKEVIPLSLEDTVVVPAVEQEQDMILQTIKEDEVPDQVLKAVMWGLAEEQSSLKTLREKKQQEGKDSSHISVKRGTLLKYMSETLLQRQALTGPQNDTFDLRGPKFREVFKMFLEIISKTFDEVKIPPEYKELFFQALSKNLEGWEEKAEKIAKNL